MPEPTTFAIPDEAAQRAELVMDDLLGLEDWPSAAMRAGAIREALDAVKLDIVRAYFTPEEIRHLSMAAGSSVLRYEPEVIEGVKKLEALR